MRAPVKKWKGTKEDLKALFHHGKPLAVLRKSGAPMLLHMFLESDSIKGYDAEVELKKVEIWDYHLTNPHEKYPLSALGWIPLQTVENVFEALWDLLPEPDAHV